jgi:hypothetical protein
MHTKSQKDGKRDCSASRFPSQAIEFVAVGPKQTFRRQLSLRG